MALTIIVSLYLLVQLIAMIGMFFVMFLGWGLHEKTTPLPWPVFMFWAPFYLVQALIIGYVLWFLWRRPKADKPDPFAVY